MQLENHEVRANCKTYSEWSVDKDGNATYQEHQYEGCEVLGYLVTCFCTEEDCPVMEGDDTLTFEQAKEMCQRAEDNLTNK